MTAAEHAERASTLLGLAPEEGSEILNAPLAQAHALTAIALSFTNALPAVRVPPAAMEGLPRTVWVAYRGGDPTGKEGPVGVYTSLDAGIEAHPIPPKPRRIQPSWEHEPGEPPLPEPVWEQECEGQWWNGLDLWLVECAIGGSVA